MRGLKRYDALNMPEYLGSHLLQMRGLKRVRHRNRDTLAGSHLLQMRGLKLLGPVDAKSAPLVASFTDAWIETHDPALTTLTNISRIFYRCVD